MNVIDFLENNGIKYKLTGNQDEIRICCPFCQELKFKTYLNGTKELGICFKCSHAGNIRYFLKELGEIDESDKYTINTTGLLKEQPSLKDKTETCLPNNTHPIWNSDDFLGEKARDYLINKRGLLKEEIEEYQLHYYFDANNCGAYILFPVYNEYGRMVSWQGKRYYMMGQKALNPKEDDGKKYLFNINRNNNKDFIVLVESPLDAIHTHRKLKILDSAGSISLLGHHLSKTHAALIKSIVNPIRVYLAMDPDKPGLESIPSITKTLRMVGINDIYVCKLTADPDEMGDSIYTAIEMAEEAPYLM